MDVVYCTAMLRSRVNVADGYRELRCCELIHVALVGNLLWEVCWVAVISDGYYGG